MWDPGQVIKPCLSFLPCKMVIMPTLKGHVTNEIMYALHLAQCLVHRRCFVLVSRPWAPLSLREFPFFSSSKTSSFLNLKQLQCCGRTLEGALDVAIAENADTGMRWRCGSPIGQVVAAGVLLLGSWAGAVRPGLPSWG